MLLPNPQELPPWDSANAQVLRDFLTSSTGEKVFAFLQNFAPPFSDGSDPNKTLVSAGRREGFELAIQVLVDLTRIQPQQQETTTNYPDLDRDELWNDPPELIQPTIAPKPSEQPQDR